MKQNILNPKKVIKYLAIAGAEVLVLFFPALLLFVLLCGLVGMAFGFNAFSNTTDFQTAQMLLWASPALAAIFYVIYRLIAGRTNIFIVIARVLLLVSIPLLVLGGLGGALVIDAHANKTTDTCNLANTLDSAISATYPISTDTEAGSAFAVDSEGTLVTAYHVIQGAKVVYMNLAGDKEQLEIISTQPASDLALLKYSRPTPHFIKLSTNPVLGESVYALGYPGNTFFEGKSTITNGIVSRLIDNSDVKAIDSSAPDGLSFVQTDAAINPGNSGGPLIDRCGMIGVVDSISDSQNLHKYGLGVSEQNISYAISASTMKSSLGL